MDLIKILRARIDALGEGPYTEGLRSVLQHVEVASSHLRRGGEAPDDTAFTDAIYRTNQAYEGSLKEAYRVLAGKDPMRARPYDIERFLQTDSLVRERVVEQMSRYRTEWRNPSTHDYKLDFDEDEALLAIVSVCAFAVVLIDQIAEKLSFDLAKAAAATAQVSTELSLADLVATALFTLDLHPFGSGAAVRRVLENQVIGAIAGHLAAILPNDAEILTEAKIGDKNLRADLIIRHKSESVLLEVKRTQFSQNIRGVAISQVSRYIAVSGIRDAVLFMFDDALSPLERDVHELPGIGARIVILAPSKRSPA